MLLPKRALLLLFGCAALFACQPAFGAGCNGWRIGTPQIADWFINKVDLENDQFVEVPIANVEAALDLLGRKSVIELDPTSLRSVLPNMPYPSRTDRRPFLVREAVLIGQDPSGSTHATQVGKDLVVTYGGPIQPGVCEKRAAVVFLPERPRRLYLSISLYF